MGGFLKKFHNKGLGQRRVCSELQRYSIWGVGGNLPEETEKGFGVHIVNF